MIRRLAYLSSHRRMRLLYRVLNAVFLLVLLAFAVRGYLAADLLNLISAGAAR